VRSVWCDVRPARRMTVAGYARAIVLLAGCAPAALAQDAATDAAAYRAHCAACHGTKGASDTPSARALKVAPFVDDARLAAMAPAEIVAIIRANGKHRAVADLTGLSDAELLAAARHVRRLCDGR
jgi:mono/diheme cytochrome c family protein